MHNKSMFYKLLVAVAVSCLFSTASFAQTPTLQNASFDNFIAASDSFPYWQAGRDSTSGQRFTITQETTGAYSAPGCLKMAITTGADSSTKCSIMGNINGLAPGQIVTISAMVKYSNMPKYWNAMINLQQATLTPGTWAWTNRKWSSMWGNDSGNSDWSQVSMSDTTVDSANVFQLIISHSGSGTFWVDDITVTSVSASVTQKAITAARRGSIVNNHIAFPSAMPYTLEAFGVNGKTVLKRSTIASSVDFNRLNLNSGAYIIRVKTAEKMWSGRVLVGK